MLIAQISDLHLRTDGSLMHGRVDTVAALADCVAHVNGLDPRPYLVLATGDLVDLALPEDYRALRAMLDRLAMPVYVIPAITTTARRCARRSASAPGMGIDLEVGVLS